MQKALEQVLKYGIYLTPVTVLIYANRMVFPYITPKLLILYPLVSILFATWMILLAIKPEYRFRPTPLQIIVTIFLLILTASTISGDSPLRSLWSVQARGLGLISLIHFYLLFIILSGAKKLFSFQKYWLITIGSSAVMSILAMVQPWAAILPGTAAARPGSTLGNPAFMAGYLVFTILLGVWLWHSTNKEKKWHRAGIAIITILNILALFISQTRGAILGLAVGCVVLICTNADENYKRKLPLKHNHALIIGLILLCATLIIGITHKAPLWQKIPGLNRIVSISFTDTSVSDRVIVWGIALEAWQEKPILGWGPENFRYAFDSHYDPRLLRGGSIETFWDKPHNAPLEILASTGILGFLAYATMFGYTIWLLIKHSNSKFRPIGLAIILGYLTQSLVFFDTYGTYLLLFAMLAYVSRVDAPIKSSLEKNKKIAKPAFFTIAATTVIALGFVIPTYIKIARANVHHFNGLNYFFQGYGEDGAASWRAALAIDQPYKLQIEQNFVTAIADMVTQFELVDEKEIVDQALAVSANIRKNDPNNYLPYITEAETRTTFTRIIDPKYLEGANELIDSADKISPNRQQTHFVRAKVLIAEGKIDEAFEESQKAIDLDPQVGRSHFLHGLLAYQFGRLDEALTALEAGLGLGYVPNTAIEYQILGSLYGDYKEDYPRAAQYFEEALARNAHNVELRAKVALAQFLAGNHDRARILFNEVLPTVDSQWWQGPSYESLKPILDSLDIFPPAN